MNDQVEKDLFDFANLSDLPEDLQGKLTRDTDEAVKSWAAIVSAGVARGFTELSINQITAVAHRSGIEVPTQQTVRNYLNRAVELKLIGKPTRMSYGAVGAASAAAPVAAAVAVVAEEADPLAGIE